MFHSEDIYCSKCGGTLPYHKSNCPTLIHLKSYTVTLKRTEIYSILIEHSPSVDAAIDIARIRCLYNEDLREPESQVIELISAEKITDDP